MQKQKIATLMLTLLLLLTACGEYNKNSNTPPASASLSKPTQNVPFTEDKKHMHSTVLGDFKLDIISDKAIYEEGDIIPIHATLTYIGEEDEITIGHAMYPVGFYLYEESRNLYIYGAMAEPYIETTLQKDVPVQYELKGIGGYDENTTKAEKKFNEAAMSMNLLKGNYDIYASASFHIVPTGVNETPSPIHFEAGLPVTVK